MSTTSSLHRRQSQTRRGGGEAGGCVLLTGAEYTGGLAALRGLHRAGYRTWVATTDPHSYGALSRAAAGVIPILDPRVDPDGFAHGLAAAATRIVRVRPHVLSGVRPDVPRSRRVVTVMS
ncbi:hypothetical protein [Pseudonocardia dioxanivorans]|uniref:hypothetical protein n=1 Tax=Pseudonocardia dioxanivorans TaxID=240495 RepID=UPI000CD0F865|nr:hypothetical protein [Pseudonocardia dioxanivorans]